MQRQEAEKLREGKESLQKPRMKPENLGNER